MAKKSAKRGTKAKAKPKAKATKKLKRDKTINQIEAATGFSTSQIRRFVKKGLPHSIEKHPKRGRPRYFLSLVEVVEWCSDNGIVTPDGKRGAGAALAKATAEAYEGKSPSKDSDSPEGGGKQSIDMDKLNSLGIIGSCERLRLAEYNASRLLLRRVKEGASRDELSGLERLHTRIAATLRLTEFSVLKYRVAHGELVKFGEMVTAWERVGTGFKNAVLGLPSSCVPRLLHLLKDPTEGMHEVEKILEEECRRALVSLPDEIPGGSSTKDNSGGDTTAAS